MRRGAHRGREVLYDSEVFIVDVGRGVEGPGASFSPARKSSDPPAPPRSDISPPIVDHWSFTVLQLVAFTETTVSALSCDEQLRGPHLAAVCFPRCESVRLFILTGGARVPRSDLSGCVEFVASGRHG